MNISETPAVLTMNAIATFGTTPEAEIAYLKIMRDANGAPYLTCIKQPLSFIDTLHWYFVPHPWNRFSLQNISEICQKTLLDGQIQSKFNLDQWSGVAYLNSKIANHNTSVVDKDIINIFYYRLKQVTVPSEIESKILEKELDPYVTEIPKGVGIGNSGNTCYQNSLIQSLRNSKAFRNKYNFPHLTRIFKQIESQDKALNGNNQLMHTLRSWLTSEEIRFYTALDGTQEDAHELLTKILEHSGSVFSIKDTNPISSEPYISNNSLLLALENEVNNNPTSIQKLITNQKTEFLKEDAPEFLPITVLRFRNYMTTEIYHEVTFTPPFWVERTRDVWKVKKIHQATEPDAEITIPGSDGSNIKYQLRSIILHSGDSPKSGHYIAVAPQENEDQNWTEYNDDKVTAMKSADYLEKIKTEGYVYFYDRVE